MCLASLFRRHASDHVGAIRESFLDMESTLQRSSEHASR